MKSSAFMDNNGQSPLNQFLLNKLKENNCNGQTNTQNCNGLILPILKFPTADDLNKSPQRKFEIPLLRGIQENPNPSNHSSANQLNTILTNLQISDTCIPVPTSSIPDIDLSTALASRSINNTSSPANQTKSVANTSDISETSNFKIAFIDCEQDEDITKDTSLQQSPDNDNYCRDLKDLSFADLDRFIAAPSGIGRILNSCSRRYIGPQTPPYRSLQTKADKVNVKYKIERFQFNTKSPDDIIIAALKR